MHSRHRERQMQRLWVPGREGLCSVILYAYSQLLAPFQACARPTVNVQAMSKI